MSSRVDAVGGYVKEVVTAFANAGDMAKVFELGIAWGVYSAIEVLDGDFYIDVELKHKFIEAYLNRNTCPYFADLVRVHRNLA